jgi:hypothetical protein
MPVKGTFLLVRQLHTQEYFATLICGSALVVILILVLDKLVNKERGTPVLNGDGPISNAHASGQIESDSIALMMDDLDPELSFKSSGGNVNVVENKVIPAAMAAHAGMLEVGAHVAKEIQTWTEAEDKILKEVVSSQKQLHWKEIAEHLPNRTNVQCYQRWHRTLKKAGVVRRCWTTEEDELLKRAICDTKEKAGKDALSATEWRAVALNLPGKSSKQCRKRWTHVLDPSLKKTKWTDSEDEVLVKAHGELGNRWAAIARLLPGRTELHVRDRWRQKQALWAKAQEAKQSIPVSHMQHTAPLHLQRQQIAQQWHAQQTQFAATATTAPSLVQQPQQPTMPPKSMIDALAQQQQQEQPPKSMMDQMMEHQRCIEMPAAPPIPGTLLVQSHQQFQNPLELHRQQIAQQWQTQALTHPAEPLLQSQPQPQLIGTAAHLLPQPYLLPSHLLSQPHLMPVQLQPRANQLALLEQLQSQARQRQAIAAAAQHRQELAAQLAGQQLQQSATTAATKQAAVEKQAAAEQQAAEEQAAEQQAAAQRQAAAAQSQQLLLWDRLRQQQQPVEQQQAPTTAADHQETMEKLQEQAAAGPGALLLPAHPAKRGGVFHTAARPGKKNRQAVAQPPADGCPPPVRPGVFTPAPAPRPARDAGTNVGADGEENPNPPEQPQDMQNPPEQPQDIDLLSMWFILA